jgi:hypothetical protein
MIEITVDAQGRTQVQTRGFSGAECREASKFLEQALGSPVNERLTEEYFQASQARNELQQGS